MRILCRMSHTVLLVLAGLLAADPVWAQVDVLTQRYDSARSATNLKETKLNKSNVNKNQFGKLAFRIVDGNVYAQPLIVSQAKIANRTDATNVVIVATEHNVVIVATEHNSVYAFDAEDTESEPSGQESKK